MELSGFKYINKYFRTVKEGRLNETILRKKSDMDWVLEKLNITFNKLYDDLKQMVFSCVRNKYHGDNMLQ